MKEDIKYIKEFQEFTYNLPKKSRKSKYIENPEEERRKKRIEFDTKYKTYFTKYIVRFAKVSLHKENLKGRLFGFANYFIDLLHKNAYEYTKFQRAFGGEFKKEDDKKVFYCDVFTIISQIIEDNLGKKEIMDYLDVDISFNLSSSEHQTEFSENLRQCRSSGKPRSDAISMLEFGVLEKFDTKLGVHDVDENDRWHKEALDMFFDSIPGFYGNSLAVQAKKNNYPNYDLPREQYEPPVEPLQFGDLREEIENKSEVNYDYEEISDDKKREYLEKIDKDFEEKERRARYRQEKKIQAQEDKKKRLQEQQERKKLVV